MSTLIARLDARSLGDIVPTDLTAWYVGAIGEQIVGHELALLPEGWRVLHAVPVGPVADIDHLVIGPPGVVVINTKRHPDKRVRVGTRVVWIDGYQENHYQQRLRERADRVSGIFAASGIRSPVHPMLVFVDARSIDHAGPQTVHAWSSAQLLRHLARFPAVLSSEEIDAAFRAAVRPSTWGRTDSILHEPDPMERFLRLRLAPSHPVARIVHRGRVPARGRATSRKPQPRPSPRMLIAIIAIVAGLAALPAIGAIVILILTALFRAVLQH